VRRFANRLSAFAADARGATAIEYGLIAALMAVAAIASMMLFGNSLAGVFGFVSNHVSNAATG
jgi:pilus assembly protein Flp/PilA